jgi:hypothetical protein
MRPPWRQRKPEPPPPVYVGSHDDKLTRIRRLHVDPDDDQPTREDMERAAAYRDASSWSANFGHRRR